jgi:hypothetical protein
VTKDESEQVNYKHEVYLLYRGQIDTDFSCLYPTMFIAHIYHWIKSTTLELNKNCTSSAQIQAIT